MCRITMRVIMAACVALLLAGCGDKNAQPEQGVGAEANWTAPGGAADEAGYSRLTTITPNNVDKLGPAWSLDLLDEVTLESTPLAAMGRSISLGAMQRFMPSTP